MTQGYDAVVIGMGPGGEVAATRLLKAGKRVAMVDHELIGGECGYWACIPSKTLLRPVETGPELVTQHPETEAQGRRTVACWAVEARGVHPPAPARRPSESCSPSRRPAGAVSGDEGTYAPPIIQQAGPLAADSALGAAETASPVEAG